MFMIFLDDERSPEDVTWIDYSVVDEFIVVRNHKDFMRVFEGYFMEEVLISFDHDIQSFNDLGEEETGYDCLKAMCNRLSLMDINTHYLNIECVFHTQNPIGKKNMETYWNNFKEVYNIK